jgi:hypothetical protein
VLPVDFLKYSQRGVSGSQIVNEANAWSDEKVMLDYFSLCIPFAL